MMDNFFNRGIPTPYEKNADKRAETARLQSSAKDADIQDQYNAYGSGTSNGFKVTGTAEERQKALDGLNLAKVGYGQDIFKTGQDISGIRQKLQDRSNQSDPISEAIRGQKAGAVANANRSMAASGVKGGAAAGAVSNIERAQNADIAASLYGQQGQSIAAERSLASNTLSGTTGLMQGGKAEGTPIPDAPKAASWTDSVICTELYKQGLMPLNIYAVDAAYGEVLKENAPHVVVGYHFLAKPVVELMQVSALFTKLVAPAALKWARYIAGEYSHTGWFLFNFGQPLCGIIGKIKLLGEKYVPFSYH